MKKILATLACGVLPVASFAAPACSKRSPAHTIALLELYTSEGCSSCPPADRFLRGFRDGANAALVPDHVVPLSLHVDYWDYIGWKDRYAKPEFTERQRWLTAQAGSRTIYTPEFFVNGRELGGWRDGTLAAVKRINDQPARANIEIGLGNVVDGKLPVEVRATSAMTGQLFVALYESGLTSDVHAGENRGVVLRHDYVAREWLGPVSLMGKDAVKKAELASKLALPEEVAERNFGVAAFVQKEDGEVIQAVGMDICSGK